jgi:hypothetical protein
MKILTTLFSSITCFSEFTSIPSKIFTCALCSISDNFKRSCSFKPSLNCLPIIMAPSLHPFLTIGFPAQPELVGLSQ